METMQHKLLLRFINILNVVLVTLPFGACWYLVYAPQMENPYYNKGNWAILALFCVLYVTYCQIYDGHRIGLSRISELIGSQLLALLFSDALMYGVSWLLIKYIPPILPLIAVLFAQGVLASAWCLWAHRWYFHTFAPKRTAVIYNFREGLEDLISAYGLEKKFSVIETVDLRTVRAENLALLEQVEVVFLFGVHSHERNIILKQCIARGMEVYLIPTVGDVLMSGAKRMHLFHLPILRAARYNPGPEYLFVKRAMDLAASGLGLVVLSPVMLGAALAIHWTDGGPVFYRQKRLTQNGRVFEVLKFRSMRVDAEKDGVARLSTGETDDRITPVGRVLRKYRLDELPQLINILRGEMSLVGPRPERPEIAAQYQQELPEFSLRLQAKAGLTGYAQVYGKYNTTPYDKLKMDLMYIANPSLGEDLMILFATIKILFQPESTEGIKDGRTTAAQ